MILKHIKDLHRRPYETKAIQMLQDVGNYPGLAPWKDSDIRFRLIRLPSFEAYTVWVLHQENDTFHIRRLEWDRLLDAQKPATPPTIFSAEVGLPEKVARQLIANLAAISLPPFMSGSSLGLDGISHAIEFGDCWRSSSFSWWGHPPREWRELAGWYDQAVEIFEAALPVSPARFPSLRTGTS